MSLLGIIRSSVYETSFLFMKQEAESQIEHMVTK